MDNQIEPLHIGPNIESWHYWKLYSVFFVLYDCALVTLQLKATWLDLTGKLVQEKHPQILCRISKGGSFLLMNDMPQKLN